MIDRSTEVVKRRRPGGGGAPSRTRAAAAAMAGVLPVEIDQASPFRGAAS